MTFGADDLLELYANGKFPMAPDRNSTSVSIIEPELRGIMPLDGIHVPKRLARTVKQDKYSVHINRNFARVIHLCAVAAADREETWINGGIEYLCHQLFLRGHAHSVECYEENKLVGGLYGITLGGAFFGESMFSRARDASKVALVHLCAHLLANKFDLLDTQFLTGHLMQFGAIEIERKAYLQLLAPAVKQQRNFTNLLKLTGGQALAYLQSSTQTS